MKPVGSAPRSWKTYKRTANRSFLSLSSWIGKRAGSFRAVSESLLGGKSSFSFLARALKGSPCKECACSRSSSSVDLFEDVDVGCLPDDAGGGDPGGEERPWYSEGGAEGT